MDPFLKHLLNDAKELNSINEKKEELVNFVQANHCVEQVGSVLKPGTTGPCGRTSRYNIIKNEFRMIDCFPNTSFAEKFRLT